MTRAGNMIKLDPELRPPSLLPAIDRLLDVSGKKILKLNSRWSPSAGAPVFTKAGVYTSRGWTEWTQGFQFGAALLQFELTRDEQFLKLGRGLTLAHMTPHLTHVGVHDHGFNIVSTYGNLLRLVTQKVIASADQGREIYVMALKVSGAVQACRWTRLGDRAGFIYSFNGPHSLFADTIRSLRSLAIAYVLRHRLLAENDQPIDLLERLIQHAQATAQFNVYYGEGRDSYDVPGRVAHESIFNVTDGRYRCPSTQQGYSPFTTWTRGLAWVLCGFAEQLEFLTSIPPADFPPALGKAKVLSTLEAAACATAEFYVQNTPTDGIPYWDTGAPGLRRLGDYLRRPAEPFNGHEPVDSSAAAIAAQGLIRLATHLSKCERRQKSARYAQVGLTLARTLLSDAYVSVDPAHEGLLLHSVYHRPNGWDHVPPGRAIPCGESSMWGDYHLLELALLVRSLAGQGTYPRFFDISA